MKISDKWCFAGMFIIDFIGRKLISWAFGAPNYREMITRAVKDHTLILSRGVVGEILFSALLWSLLPLWAGYKTNQQTRGWLLAAACFLISAIFPLLNLTPIVLGIGSYLYLVNRADKDSPA